MTLKTLPHYYHSCKEKSERGRSKPLVVALNNIINHFRHEGDASDSTLRLPDAKDEILFHSNDPTVIESKYLQSTTKRKPDIIALPVHANEDKNLTWL